VFRDYPALTLIFTYIIIYLKYDTKGNATSLSKDRLFYHTKDNKYYEIVKENDHKYLSDSDRNQIQEGYKFNRIVSVPDESVQSTILDAYADQKKAYDY
jgi:hypothetical protein